MAVATTLRVSLIAASLVLLAVGELEADPAAPTEATHDVTARYQLPFGAKTPRKLVQGVGGMAPMRGELLGRFGGSRIVSGKSHKGRSRYAFDFLMPVGSEVLAARGGVAKSEAWGGLILVHYDGTYAVYGHVSEVLVRSGMRVEAGALIARSGGEGESAPHLHFAVLGPDEGGRPASIPIRFDDGSPEGYVPTEGLYYGGE